MRATEEADATVVGLAAEESRFDAELLTRVITDAELRRSDIADVLSAAAMATVTGEAPL